MTVARASWMAPDASITQRLVTLGFDALSEALGEHGERLAAARARVALVVGLPARRPGQSPYIAPAVCDVLAKRAQRSVTISATRALELGHVAGMAAIEEGCRMIRSGEADACLAGGVESYLSRETLEWLDWTGQLLSPKNPRGFSPGEAAGFCLLVSEPLTHKLALPRLGTVLHAATSLERKLRRDRAVCMGEALTQSVQAVLERLESTSKVDELIHDFNGQPHRAEELGFTLARLSARFREPKNALTPASCWGDVGAASGPLFTMLAIAAGHKGYATGPSTLCCTQAMVAERCALLLHVPLEA
jgi:3-oxoacyl-[acyl-carrier-protein] synthase-1